MQMKKELPQPVLHRQRLKKVLLLGDLELCVECHQVGQLSATRHTAQEMVDDLLRNATQPAELRRSLAHFLVECGVGRVLVVQRGHVLHAAHDGLEELLPLSEFEHGATARALHDELNAPRDPLHLGDSADRAYAIQALRGRILRFRVELRHGDETLRSLECVLDGCQRLLASRGDRGGDGREYDRSA